VAFRPEPGPSLARLRGALLAQRAATELDVRGLTRAETATLVARMTSNEQSSVIVDAIYERAEGNPLFTEMLAAGVDASGDFDVPADLLLVLDGFLARTGEAAVALLERASVLGGSFTAEEILALTGSDEPEVFARLDEALATRVIEEAPGGYRFRHGLLQRALLRRLPMHRLRNAHRAAARALADTHAPASRVAQQLLRAGAAAEAAPWFSQAARDEARVSAYRSALTFLDLALAHGPATPELLSLRGDLLMATAEPAAPAAYAEAMVHVEAPRRSALAVSKARAHAALGELLRSSSKPW
jgi:predicted ATPase